MKAGKNKLNNSKKGGSVKSQVEIIDLGSGEYKTNSSETSSEGQQAKTSISSVNTHQKFTNDNYGRPPRFQSTCVKTESNNKSIKSNINYSESFNNSNDEDMDICLAAAEEASQTMRSYEPVTPAVAPFTHQGPSTDKFLFYIVK